LSRGSLEANGAVAQRRPLKNIVLVLKSCIRATREDLLFLVVAPLSPVYKKISETATTPLQESVYGPQMMS
jgi:hypothetical protein